MLFRDIRQVWLLYDNFRAPPPFPLSELPYPEILHAALIPE